MKRADKDAMPSNALKAHVRRRGQAGLIDAGQAARLMTMPARRAARALPTIGPRVRTIVRPLLRGRGASLAEISLRWKELAGTRLAKLCRPEKLVRSRDGTVLVLVARGGAGAAFVELESEALTGRINAAFGRGFVARLRITQGRIAAPGEPSSQPVRNPKPPAQALAALEQKLARLPDGPLRTSARHLGLALLARQADSR